MRLKIITITIIIGLSSCGKSYRLTDNDISFNPYKVGDSLLFQSDKDERDTIIIASIDKEKLREKCYSFISCIPKYLWGESWESYYVRTKSPDYHGEALNDILTISAETNGSTAIMFDFHIKGATWYGNTEIDNVANKLLNLKTQKITIGSTSYDDVITIPSTNKEYKKRNDFVNNLYWSRTKGLVGFDKSNGDKWTVKRK
jgi:hypothetical protein